MAERYARNKELIGAHEQALLREKTLAVVGLGGLGGHIAEQLARLGVGHLILIDADSVEASNLNRQLFATEQTLGLPKTQAATIRLAQVDATVKLTTHQTRLTPQNGKELLRGADIVFDAVDNIHSRLALEELCDGLQVPLVHGSIGGWWGQVSVVFPGQRTLSRIYPHPDAQGAEKRYGNPAFTPAVVASIQTAEALKLCLGRDETTLRGKLLRIDLLEHEYMVIDV